MSQQARPPLRRLLWELPGAVLSWGFYHTARQVLQRVYRAYMRRSPQLARQWRVTGSNLLRNRLALPIIMTAGPRWNTHAITASTGPLRVQRELAVQVALAAKSAGAWTVVVYTFPQHGTVATLDALDEADGTPWRSVQVPPGDYTLVTRYYHRAPTLELPAVQVDGRLAVPATRIDPRSNDFLHDLPARGNWFYGALHGYVYPMLRYRAWLPAGFVRREYLPMGNPETQFVYGAVAAGEAVHYRASAALWQQYDMYYTLYNRQSFPVAWAHLSEPDAALPAAVADGFYLFRLHPRTATTTARADDLAVSVGTTGA